jgi:phenylalanine-4-hydroxylase
MPDHIIELEADHPGFNDPDYRKRRDEIARVAPPLDSGRLPQRVEYTEMERRTWATVFDKLTALYPTHSCREFLGVAGDIGYSTNEVPQLADVSQFLTNRTGFSLQAVAGLVSAREFLGALSRRVFCATQYIRHHSQPLYTPEPDVVHELMGHAPMLAIPEFADLSQKIGEGSLSADDEQVEKLATLYWFTIEYGVLFEDGKLRAYGAGLLSSFGELEHALSGEVEVRTFDPMLAKHTAYPITTYQPLLWSVGSIREAFDKMDEFVRLRS